MKKLLRLLAATLAIIGLSASAVSAQSSITNGNGTDSTNKINFSNRTNIDISNRNDVDCDIDSDQDADSGNSTANGNTTVGNVSTGGASNSASLGCNVNVSNGPGACCDSKPGGQHGGGQGAGGVVAGTSTRVAVAGLPATGENSVVKGLALAAAAIGVAAIAAQSGVLAYRQSALKNL